ncbi:MAG: hypothetical protein Q7U75_16820 [Desulfobacterales bacterium]|nr:hypothetical protein [Desulfobacterales bacterium]
MLRPGFIHLDTLVDFHFALPAVMNCDPEDAAVRVESGALILFEVHYSAGGATPNLGTVSTVVNGVPAVVAGVIQPGFNGPRSGVVAYTANRILFRLDPVELAGLSTYQVVVSFFGSDGVPGSATWSFTTEDTLGPVLVAVSPLGRRSLRVQYAQAVVSDPVAASCTFPWGVEPLTLSGGAWRRNPIAYPWVKATRAGGYNLIAGQLLHVSVDGVLSTVVVPLDTTDEITTAAALDSVLSPIGAGCYARNGFAWLYSARQSGTMEVLFGGANDLLRCEAGVQSARLAFGTVPGSYTLAVSSTQPSGLISTRSITRDLNHADFEFVLYQPGEEFSSSVLVPGNYWLTVDEADCKTRRAPAYMPAVASVDLSVGESVVLTLAQAMTPGARYTLHVQNVEDVYGNHIEPDPSTVEFVGFAPTVSEARKLRLYDMFPNHLRQQDANREYQFEIVCAVFQEVIDQLFGDLDDYLVSKNPATAPIVVVDKLLCTYGNPFEFMELSADRRRVLLELLVDLYRLRGTEPGIDSALRFFFGFTTINFIYYWGSGWILGLPGRTNLGATTILNTAILARRFSFSIAVDRVLTAAERVQVRQVVERMKTAHTHFIAIEEPVAPFVPNHWQLPWSELGVNTILH